MAKAKWYVVHTYSGYENKVKANIEKTIENRGIEDAILDIQIPMEEVVEMKDDEKRVVTRKKFPGYVIIKMNMSDEAWYIVRNTRGVTGFVGPGSKPVPLTDEEVAAIGVEVKAIHLDYEVGDSVTVTGGPLKGYVGTVQEISEDKKKIKVLVSMFGRETPLELDSDSAEKLYK